MFDIAHGEERARKWPRPRGRTRNLAAKAREDRFRLVQLACKYMAPQIVSAVTSAVKGTPLMPRDLLTSMMYGRLAMFIMDDGRKLWPVVARSDVSEALDTITQTPGDMLIRTEEGWVGVPLAELVAAAGPWRAHRAAAALNVTGDGTVYQIIFDAEDTPANFASLTPASPNIAISQDGLFLVSATVSLNGGNGQDFGSLQVFHNGVARWFDGQEYTDETFFRHGITAVINAVAGDTIAVSASTGGGAKNMDLIPTYLETAVQITRLG
jgi:hypothetical protein